MSTETAVSPSSVSLTRMSYSQRRVLCWVWCVVTCCKPIIGCWQKSFFEEMLYKCRLVSSCGNTQQWNDITLILEQPKPNNVGMLFLKYVSTKALPKTFLVSRMSQNNDSITVKKLYKMNVPGSCLWHQTQSVRCLLNLSDVYERQKSSNWSKSTSSLRKSTQVTVAFLCSTFTVLRPKTYFTVGINSMFPVTSDFSVV